MENIESIMEPYPTGLQSKVRLWNWCQLMQHERALVQETVEVVPVDPERVHLPSQACAPQDALTEVTSSMPASLPPLAPALQTSLGPMAPCLAYLEVSYALSVRTPGVREKNMTFIVYPDTYLANAVCWQSVIDQMEYKRGALVDLESAIPSKVPTPSRRWARERDDAEEEF